MAAQAKTKGLLWGIVLAAGEGKRISTFVRLDYGLRAPKQYVAFTGKRSMLQHTLERAERLIPSERILCVVSPDHIEDIKTQLSERPAGTVIFQPRNRETLPGVLLPLIYIFKRDPEARVVILPSDHFIQEEDRFMRYVEYADAFIRWSPDETVLLGIQPEGLEVDYGWIEPSETVLDPLDVAVRRVGRFLEKPNPELASAFFLKKRFLWNIFVTITRAKTLIQMTKAYHPQLWLQFERMMEAMGTKAERATIENEYREMKETNLSRDLFERVPERISVIEVKDVLWSDWGDGTRVEATLKKLGKLPVHVSRPLEEAKPSVEKKALGSHRGRQPSMHERLNPSRVSLDINGGRI